MKNSMSGFLGTGATLRADINLTVQLAMGIALLCGMYLARRKRFRAHKYCQASVMVLNLIMIFLIMAPSFHRQVEPQPAAALKQAYYLVPWVHAILGTFAELLGLYIVLVAATRLIPGQLRFKRYRPWMRTELAVWWLVILIGLGTYYIWYLAPSNAVPVPVSQPASARRVTIRISNFQFEPRDVTITAGTVVEWLDDTGRHTVEADDGSFHSTTLTAGESFEHTFNSPGEYPYYCNFHGDKHGKDMSGKIVVTR